MSILGWWAGCYPKTSPPLETQSHQYLKQQNFYLIFYGIVTISRSARWAKVVCCQVHSLRNSPASSHQASSTTILRWHTDWRFPVETAITTMEQCLFCVVPFLLVLVHEYAHVRACMRVRQFIVQPMVSTDQLGGSNMSRNTIMCQQRQWRWRLRACKHVSK